jgi:chromate reductase, NAD(P)H dehydrogenase (quinone)
MADKFILIVSGTNRPGSNAMRVTKILESHYKAAGITTRIYSLTEMPAGVFDGAAYATKPEGFVAHQQLVLDAAGLHVVTPEYNGSFPGVLKYWIDMLKFPESFERKPVTFTGESAGIWGAIRSIEQLQMIFGYRNAHIYPDRVFIPGIGQKLDDAGRLIDPAIDDRLAKQAQGFAKFVGMFIPAAAS